ncbi:hypothetical protein ACH4TX_42395 [Streptomyces sp. NPDC021098]|uniref:hypothetical protein n=1 Tax=unclassified Streptomyces TaxID=2593676 RepID=UPI0037BACEF9
MTSGARGVLTAAAALAALGLVAGCGDADRKADGKPDQKVAQDEGGDKGGGGGAAARPLSAAALERAALAKSDLKGYGISPMTEREFSGGKEAKALTPGCQPLAALMGTGFDPAPRTSVYRSYAAAPGGGAGVSGVLRLSSYRPGDAERTVRDLRKAVSACSGGFKATDGSGKRADVTEVTSRDAPEAGDEALAYSMVDGGKEKAVIAFTVVRSGPQLTVVFGVNLSDPTRSAVPKTVVDRQVRKVEAANRS